MPLIEFAEIKPLLFKQVLCLTSNSFIYNKQISQRPIKLRWNLPDWDVEFSVYSFERKRVGTPGGIRTPDLLLRRKPVVFHAFHPFAYFSWVYTNSGLLLSLEA